MSPGCYANRAAAITMNTMGKETAKIATPNMIAIAKNVQARQLVMGLP